MELSLKSEYAILALIELANSYELNHPIQIRQIASHQNIPDRYLEQLLAILRRHGLVKSQRGSKGGYVLAKEPRQINILEIICCIEGKDAAVFDYENLQPQKTSAAAVVDKMWKAAQLASENVLKNCTLKDICEQEKQYKLMTAMYYI